MLVGTPISLRAQPSTSLRPSNSITTTGATRVHITCRRSRLCLHSVALSVCVSAFAPAAMMDGECICRARAPRPLTPVLCHGSCVAEVLNALTRTRPVLRMGDDTHTERATTFRSQPLVALAVRRRGALLPARHVSRPGLVGLRAAGAVASAVALVAAVGLALLAPHRLGARIPPARVAGVSRIAPHRAWRRVTSQFSNATSRAKTIVAYITRTASCTPKKL